MLGKLLKKGPRYRWKKVVLIVTASCFVLSGSATASYLFYQYAKHLHATSEASVIQSVVQTAGQYAPLQTTYLAEVLELSHDRAVNLSQFDLEEAHERLMATHVIREALIKKIKPDILYLDYEVRKPIAYLGDYTNTALDQEGMLFPYMPYFPPRQLPQVYLGSKAPPNPWGKQIEAKQMSFVEGILKRFAVGTLARIDLSQCEASSAGARQIVVVLQKGTILRITPKNYAQELANYFMLEEQMVENALVIDLRNPEVAYISYGK